ncbi:hypothetical protein [Hyphococcus sp.]|uniref:hypothetical protein n=1 Tax=Hyphococcus sp. TaxID=2038636 RepID=UPI00208870F8|nr:MAG: hypothetical protein DHS20C04_19970 [Marinicaulis sp.]
MATLPEISTLISQRDLAGAAEGLRKFVKRNTKRPADWPTAMQLAMSLGDQETTLTAARASLAQAPQDPRRMADVIEALGAVAKFDEAAQLSRKLRNNPTAAADGWYLEGIFLARKAMREEALTCFRRRLKKIRNIPPHGNRSPC